MAKKAKKNPNLRHLLRLLCYLFVKWQQLNGEEDEGIILNFQISKNGVRMRWKSLVKYDRFIQYE